MLVESVPDRLRAAIWPLFRLLFPSTRVANLDVVDVGLVTDSMEGVSALFTEATRHIESAGPDINAVFAVNLRRVAVVRDGFAKIAVAERKYGTTLRGHEGSNAFYLACRLLWVSKYIELSRTGTYEEDSRAHRDACFDFVNEFALRFPDGDAWISYMERERLRDIGT